MGAQPIGAPTICTRKVVSRISDRAEAKPIASMECECIVTGVSRVALEDSVSSEHSDGVDGMGILLSEAHGGQYVVGQG